MPRLVDDWREAWRWVSVHCMVIASALQGAWLYVPDDLRASAPPKLVQVLTIAILACGVLGRVIRQRTPGCDLCGEHDADAADR